ncbi:hypothetical protein QUB36_03720 [Microcoleus sp. AT8-B1]|uniref:hypothetical protein n=1 Tax=unclassified Microcoleus TaxID=2642155 RepID=UPI002FD39607
MIPKQNSEAKQINPLSRFVTKEAVAKVLKVKPEQIREIRCWAYVIHVVGVGISRFVSYGDMPPILGVEPPTLQDCIRWRKRWRSSQHRAPIFWVDFYEGKFRQSRSVEELYNWGKLVGKIKQGLLASQVKWLRNIYCVAKECLAAF